jgi:hypothetical protein
MVVEAGLEMFFLLRTPIVTFYGHGLHIYWTCKTLKKEAYNTTYMTHNHITIMVSYILPELPRS